MNDWGAYLVISVFWGTLILSFFLYLHMRRFSCTVSVTYAWGLFFIAHALYEIPYAFFYLFFTNYRTSPIMAYLILTGIYFMAHLTIKYPTLFRVFEDGLPFELGVSSLVLACAYYFGAEILSDSYGLNPFCWLTRILAVVFTGRLAYGIQAAV